MLNNHINSSNAVTPSYLFSLFVRAAIIRNADLVNSGARLCHLRGNLRFKPKPVLFNSNAVQEFAPKHFVTCFHVSEVQVCKHVGEQREKSVSHHMPEVNHAMRPAAHEPGTEHNVGTILQNRRKEDGVFVRVILQVGVLNDYDVARSCLETGAQSCSLAKIAFLQHDLIDPPVRFSSKKFSRSVGRSVVHNDNFHVFDRRRANCFNHSFDRWSLIITRDNDGELHLSSLH